MSGSLLRGSKNEHMIGIWASVGGKPASLESSFMASETTRAPAEFADQAVTLPGISILPADTDAGTSKPDYRSIAVLSISHVLDDLNQGALPTLLPYLMVSHHLTYQSAAGLVLTTNLFSSLLQPWLGTLSDRPSWKINLAPIGLLMAGVGVSFSGLMPNYMALCAGAAFTGIGLAAYHPDAARTTNFVSGAKKGLTGMSFFALGGNLGFALGTTGSDRLRYGHGECAQHSPSHSGHCRFFVLHRHMKGLSATILQRKHAAKKLSGENQRDRWLPFTFLTLTIICRSIMFFGFNTFVPLYWVSQLGQTKAAGGVALTVLLMSSAVGTLLGGKFAGQGR